MFKRKCFCGKSEKTFWVDIGENFHNDECCVDAGFDHLGQRDLLQVLDEVKSEPVVEVAPRPPAEVPGPEVKLGRGKLRDLTVVKLKLIAESRGLVVPEPVTKPQLVDLIFNAQA